MFRTEELESLDRSYFSVICADAYDVTIMSKNTGHVWYIHNPEYPEPGNCIIFYRFAESFLPKSEKNCRLLSPHAEKKELIKRRYSCTLPARFLAVL